MFSWLVQKLIVSFIIRLFFSFCFILFYFYFIFYAFNLRFLVSTLAPVYMRVKMHQNNIIKKTNAAGIIKKRRCIKNISIFVIKAGSVWVTCILYKDVSKINIRSLRQYFAKHYENTPIQIYWKFYHQKMAIFQIKKLIFYIFLLKT